MRVHEGERRRTSAGDDLNVVVIIIIIIIIIIIPLLVRLHLARGGSSGEVGSACGRYGMRHSEEREMGNGVPLHPKGSSSSSSSMAGKVRYTAGRRGRRTYSQAGGRRLRRAGLSIWRGRKQKREDIPSSSADSESASCTSSSMAGVSYTARRKGGLASTYPLLNEEVVG